MPTKDSGKPTSRRPAAAGGKGPEPTAQATHTGKRKSSGSKSSGSQKSTPRAPRAPRRRAPREPGIPLAPPAPLVTSGTLAAAPEPTGEEVHEPASGAFPEPSVPEKAVGSVPEPRAAAQVGNTEQIHALHSPLEEPPSAGEAEIEAAGAGASTAGELTVLEPEHDERPDDTEGSALPGGEPARRRDRRGAGTNALGLFIERQFANPTSPAHSYSDLERHSRISREALSRYVTARADRRRSPTIDTLVAIADALHVSLEAVARAAAASAKGVIPPPENVQHAREETLGALVAALSDDQFSAVVELLRQMRPPIGE